MKQNRIFLSSLMILIMSTICLVGSAAAASQTIPFKGRIVGEFIGTPTNDPFVFDVVANAHGNGTHVGRFTKVTSDTFNLATGATTGTFTMTTANGDLLTGQYAGFTIATSASTFSWNLDTIITGGTGRFANATGNFVFEAQGEFSFTSDGNLVGNYTETFSGTISY